MRLTVEVPDDADPAYARQLVQSIEEHLGGRAAYVMVRRPPGIPDEQMPVLVARCAALFHAAAAVSSLTG